MAYGLFGKVPQKRDFMSVNMPSAVLSPFETWLQAAVAASRNELGKAWQDHYLVAPIWRFWIGEHILGTTVAGALMPSVDQVGRYFPLSIMYFAEDGRQAAAAAPLSARSLVREHRAAAPRRSVAGDRRLPAVGPSGPRAALRAAGRAVRAAVIGAGVAGDRGRRG